MNYIILDLEWNQGTEGKTGESHEELPFEIIEIGAMKLDEHKNMVGQFNELVRPVVYKNMHHITENMMHIHMKDLEQGKPFCDVMTQFLAWCGEDYIFCTWGCLDLLELQRNMKYHGMPVLSDGPICFLDIQKLFGIAFENNKSRRSLEYAIDFLHIEKDIAFHRAFSDAYYTAKILEKIPVDTEEYCSYDVFTLPSCKEAEIHKIFPSYSKYISREFTDKKEAISDREVMSTKCYICHKNAKRKVKWFTPNGKHYYSVSFGEKHGYIKGKVRIKKPIFRTGGTESVYVVKTMKLIPLEKVNEIIEKRNHVREIRKIKRKQ